MAMLEVILRGQDLSPTQLRLVFDTVLSIQKSTYFSKSKRFPALLEYVVRYSTEGDAGKLKERTIGIDIFDRPEDYDACIDPVARVAIAEVRKRLALYYSEHLDAEIRIDLPVGSYEPEFHVRTHKDDAFLEPLRRNVNDGISDAQIARRDTVITVGTPEVTERPNLPLEHFEHREHLRVEAPTGSDLDTVNLPKRQLERKSPLRFQLPRRLFFGAVIAAVALLIALECAHLLSSFAAINRFWAPVLKSQGQVLIAIALPSSGPPGAFADSPDSMGNFLTKQSNFPMPDVGVADSIKTFLANQHRESVISLAPSTTLSELHRAPAVVLGSSRMNRWVQFLSAGLHFQFELDQGGRVHWIQDTSNPTNRNWAVNLSVPYNQVTNEYALITRGSNSTTGQWWIGIGSTTGLGTIGAEQILTNPNAMKALNAQLPKGWEYKNLQIVIEFKVVDGSLGASHVVATYLW